MEYIIGLIILGVFVLFLIIAIILLTLYFLRRLKLQNDKLSNIEKILCEKDTPLRSLPTKLERPQTDSAVDVSELESTTGSLDMRENGVFRNMASTRNRNNVISIITRTSIHTLTTTPNRGPILPSQVVDLTQVTENNPKNEQTTPDDIKLSTNFADEFMNVYEKYFKKNVQDRPTSVLVKAEAGREEIKHESGMFVHKEMDMKGGEMKISGVTLKIPKDALEKKTAITLGITWEKNLFPDLKREQALLSPLVVCQPSMSFKKPVELTFPHCADKIETNWKWKIIKRTGDITQQGSWSDVTLEDYEERRVTKSSVTIHLRHFTLFTLIGTSQENRIAAKSVQIVAFSTVLQRASLFTSKLYCINDYGRDIKEIKGRENEVNRKTVDSPVPLLVYDNGENVVLDQSRDPEGWKLMGKKSNELDFELVWHSCNPNCSFAYKPQSNEVTKIIVEYACYQIKHEAKKSSIQIAAEAPKLLPTPFDEKQSEMTRKLVLCLDPVSDNNGDWKGLAERMGLKFDKIRWIEEQSGSPTELLLNMWRDKGKTIEDLRNILVEMNRTDAVSVINKCMSIDKK
ncbi:netrin receptor UNC5B-like [Saccostrea cucullata]|uniref:netrin receptor UNC5B-like n=1 Tax=Saccostrea cuccullata TaxID=36930 RepID=UPI002ED51C07